MIRTLIYATVSLCMCVKANIRALTDLDEIALYENWRADSLQLCQGVMSRIRLSQVLTGTGYTNDQMMKPYQVRSDTLI